VPVAVAPRLIAILPPTATPPADCAAPASVIAQVGFDPYAILAERRPDVLSYYVANGWDAQNQCLLVYDDWVAHGAGSTVPTTVAAYVRREGWAPARHQPTPTPFPSCAAPAIEVSQLGFDPYAVLALHRPDVLRLYQANGWNAQTQCVAIFNNWLQHPDGKAPTTVVQFVESQGWVEATSRGR